MTLRELKYENQSLFKWQLDYESSPLNPGIYGPGKAALAAACFEMKDHAFRGNKEPLDAMEALLSERSGEELTEEDAVNILYRFRHSRIKNYAEALFHDSTL